MKIIPHPEYALDDWVSEEERLSCFALGVLPRQIHTQTGSRRTSRLLQTGLIAGDSDT